jgi:hypothetical protein
MECEQQIKKIFMEVIPHAKQRYETVGDFYNDVEGNLRIYVSELKGLEHNKYELLVMIHEFIEVLLTKYHGVEEETISKFDIRFERDRKEGNVDEPGDDPNSPYKEEHCIATSVERLMCALLQCDWKDYERAVNEAE